MIISRSANLKIARIKKGLYQKEVASAIGISENSYAVTERGLRPTSGKTAKAITDFLGITFDEGFMVVEEEKLTC